MNPVIQNIWYWFCDMWYGFCEFNEENDDQPLFAVCLFTIIVVALAITGSWPF